MHDHFSNQAVMRSEVKYEVAFLQLLQLPGGPKRVTPVHSTAFASSSICRERRDTMTDSLSHPRLPSGLDAMIRIAAGIAKYRCTRGRKSVCALPTSTLT